MRCNDVMRSISISRQFNHYTYFPGSPDTSVDLWNLNKKPPRWPVPATYQPPKKWRPTLTQAPRCQLAGLEHSSSPFHQTYAYLVVKIKENYVILSNAVAHLEAIWPKIYSDRLDTSLDLTYDDSAQISGSKPHKIISSPATYSHTSSQFMNQNLNETIKHACNPRRLKKYNGSRINYKYISASFVSARMALLVKCTGQET
jgi:hypothetical protein